MARRAPAIMCILLVLLSCTSSAAGASATVRITWEILPFAVFLGEDSIYSTSIAVSTLIRFEGQTVESITIPGATTLRIVSNTNWTVHVQLVQPDPGEGSEANATWPTGYVYVRTDDGYVPVSTSPQVLCEGRNGIHVLGVDYRLDLPPESLSPGDYWITLVFLVTPG
jgi:hypothetical protein